jgi:Rrf2 family protein
MMRLNKTTRYALYAAMEMAATAEDDHVTAAGVADRYGIPAAVQAKVFQQLVRAGIAVGLRGSGGGYRLARPASRITVLEVIEALEAPRAHGDCLLHDGTSAATSDGCPRRLACRLGELFDEVDEMARCTFASISLETLIRRPQPGMGTLEKAG